VNQKVNKNENIKTELNNYENNLPLNTKSGAQK